ncbi:MAG: hypothetical protein U5K56_10690 [Halioglobus sp.]|nr:hypothetical protein [Halioglobus sp.]
MENTITGGSYELARSQITINSDGPTVDCIGSHHIPGDGRRSAPTGGVGQ